MAVESSQEFPGVRGATTAEKLRGTKVCAPTLSCAPRLAKGRAGCWVREGVAPSQCEGPGYYPQNFFENLDAKSCILVTTCCDILTTAKKLGVPPP